MPLLTLTRASLTPKQRLCLALDMENMDQARAMLDRLVDSVGIVKIGYRLGFAGGLTLIEELSKSGIKVFADFKLHDIDNTVSEGVQSLVACGASLITVHAYLKTMRAALKGLPPQSQARILGVTVMTSMDDDDLTQAGYRYNVQELVIKRAQDAVSCGLHGLVCSAQEAPILRPMVGDQLLVTPGIRFDDGANHDQKRIMTPYHAIKAGADILVIGRPILQAHDPANAARMILEQIEQALA